MTACNEKIAIPRYLTSIDGLTRLGYERRAEVQKHRRKLEDFCILGRWWFDGWGEFGAITDEDRPGYRAPASLGPCPPVMTSEETTLFMRDEPFHWSKDRPPIGDRCMECGAGWTLENLHDFKVRRIESGASEALLYTHSACHRLKLKREHRKEMAATFSKAGFPQAQLISIPNGYCPCDSCPPWYRAQVDDLPPLTIGWRKRVINIDWSESKLDLLHLFEGEDVTKENHLIHAWGYEKASEYLAKLLPALGATPQTVPGKVADADESIAWLERQKATK